MKLGLRAVPFEVGALKIQRPPRWGWPRCLSGACPGFFVGLMGLQ